MEVDLSHLLLAAPTASTIKPLLRIREAFMTIYHVAFGGTPQVRKKLDNINMLVQALPQTSLVCGNLQPNPYAITKLSSYSFNCITITIAYA